MRGTMQRRGYALDSTQSVRQSLTQGRAGYCFILGSRRAFRRLLMEYTRSSAKGWAAEKWRGVCNVIMPSFSADLRHLNERGIRHDVRRNIEHGFWGALLVSECGTTLEEYIRFMEIAVDEAKGRHHFLIHGVFDTPEDIIRIAKAGEEIGISGLLLGQPNSFYPRSED